MPHTPTKYSLSKRVSEHDDEADIELRTEHEKSTIATVDNRFVDLFIAAPELLAMLKEICGPADDCPETALNAHSFMPFKEFQKMMARARAIVARAESPTTKGELPNVREPQN